MSVLGLMDQLLDGSWNPNPCMSVVYIFDSYIDALEDFKCKTTAVPLCQTLEQTHLESQCSKGRSVWISSMHCI
jgi:hypothetical protein